MTTHRYGTYRSWSPNFPVGTRVKVLLSDEREYEAVICGPLREIPLRSSLGENFFMKTVKMRIGKEREPRSISTDRILTVISPPRLFRVTGVEGRESYDSGTTPDVYGSS